jgi:CBS domain containing-hemolysin-like protein
MFLLILYVVLALGFSFICSIAEAVLLSVTPAYVALLQEKGSRVGNLLHKLKNDVNRPLTAILTLNTIAHTVGAAGAGAQAAFVFGDESLGIASAILTLLILVFSEIIPKTIGAAYWRSLAPAVGYFLKYLVYILYPFVWLAEFLTRGMQHSELTGFSREEFASMADLGTKEGQLEESESRILKNLFRFRTSIAEDIMTPRTVVFSLEENLTVDEYFVLHPQNPFSRIPIYQKHPDQVSGYVLKNDILMAQAHDQQNTKLVDLRRDVLATRYNATLAEVFDLLVSRREQLALVVDDDYGTMVGVLTMEDVVETLLGLEIVDEDDKSDDMQALARRLWEKRARMMGLQLQPEAENNSSAEKEPQGASSL